MYPVTPTAVMPVPPDDAQVFEELLRCALVDVVAADSDETQRHHDRIALPQPDCIICALRPAFC